MRQNNLERLHNLDIDTSNHHYLHYYSFHKDLFAMLETYAQGRLLDIGCGNKPYEDLILPKITEYIGCDIVQSSENAVDILCPANNIPLPDASFDTVISTQTIEHVEDHFGLVSEANRMLKKDGYFILSGPMYWPLHEEPYDFFRFTKHGFKYILEKAGFNIIFIKANGGKWSVAGQALIHAIFPQLYYIKGVKGKMLRLIFKLFGGVKTINKFFLSLDNRYVDDSNTMNYVIVAQKR
jgi:SAM-dependent methyltransferase